MLVGCDRFLVEACCFGSVSGKVLAATVSLLLCAGFDRVLWECVGCTISAVGVHCSQSTFCKRMLALSVLLRGM